MTKIGQDLNRVWHNPIIEKHPTIYHFKQLAKELNTENDSKISLYLDLHGHSKHKGVFAFGCVVEENNDTIDDGNSVISGSSNHRRYNSPILIRTKVLRSNSTSTSINHEQSIHDLNTKGLLFQGDVSNSIIKERSHSAGPQGRQLVKISNGSNENLFISKKSSSFSESRSTPTSRSPSPARSLEKKYERVK